MKKNGEEDWKKRNTTIGTHDNNNDEPAPTSNRVNIVKQQKEQLQHQLQMAVPKPFSGGIPSKLFSSSDVSSRPPRLISGNSNDNLNEELSNKINKNYSYSNESLENLETSNSNSSQNQIQRNKYVPIGKRIILNPSDLINANTGKQLESLSLIIFFYKSSIILCKIRQTSSIKAQSN